MNHNLNEMCIFERIISILVIRISQYLSAMKAKKPITALTNLNSIEMEAYHHRIQINRIKLSNIINNTSSLLFIVIIFIAVKSEEVWICHLHVFLFM